MIETLINQEAQLIDLLVNGNLADRMFAVMKLQDVRQTIDGR